MRTIFRPVGTDLKDTHPGPIKRQFSAQVRPIADSDMRDGKRRAELADVRALLRAPKPLEMRRVSHGQMIKDATARVVHNHHGQTAAEAGGE